jgi:uncharacterized protein YbcV (DUF1398 family)
MDYIKLYETIEECNNGSFQGKISFPDVVQKLGSVGVESYYVDLRLNQTTYYLTTYNIVFLSFDYKPNFAPVFNIQGVKSAINQIREKKIDYVGFLDLICAAGCVGYFCFIGGEKVVYFGVKGDMHIEPFK